MACCDPNSTTCEIYAPTPPTFINVNTWGIGGGGTGCANECGGGSGTQIAIVKKAAYGDQCTKDAELVGHPVPPYSDANHGITNEYPIGAQNGIGAAALVGYVYTTVGGEAYFTPVASAVGVGVVSINVDTSLDIGPNALVKGVSAFGSTVAAKLNSVLKGVSNPQFMLPGPTGGACFSGGDWNGVVPA